MSKEGGTALPEDWPEVFPDPQLLCFHMYHWDDSDGVYRCTICDDTREEPK